MSAFWTIFFILLAVGQIRMMWWAWRASEGMGKLRWLYVPVWPVLWARLAMEHLR